MSERSVGLLYINIKINSGNQHFLKTQPFPQVPKGLPRFLDYRISFFDASWDTRHVEYPWTIMTALKHSPNLAVREGKLQKEPQLCLNRILEHEESLGCQTKVCSLCLSFCLWLHIPIFGTWSAVLLASQGSKIPSWSQCWSHLCFVRFAQFSILILKVLKLFFFSPSFRSHKTLLLLE